MNAAEIAAALKGKRAGSGGWTALCPAHDDHTPSLSIRDADDGKVLVRCRAGCGQQDVIEALRQRGLWPSREPQQKKRTNGPAASRGTPPFVAGYIYQQADGTPYLRVLRTATKDFPQSRWDGKKWVSGKPRGPKIPYRLPGLIGSSTVFICEGEKDADNVAKLGFGFAATTNSEGADDGKGSKWTPDLNPYFTGKTVYILADNDDAGAKHAQLVASNLHGIADSVRVVHLPGLQDKGDVSDWLEAGGTAQELLDICRAATVWTPQPQDNTHTKPPLVLSLDDWASRDLPPPDFICGQWLTTTSRALIGAPSGLGKTMLVVGLGMHLGANAPFLHWRPTRPVRVLYIDGEMSRRLLRERLADEERRLGIRPQTFYALSHEDLENFQPLNTAAGQATINSIIQHLGGVDLLILDNIMCLTAGDQKDEEVWTQTLPWVKSLTARNIGQIWLHHTGHDETKLYGTKTREWQMDTVCLLEPVKRDDTDVSFQLTFKKARERRPETRADFRDVQIALVNDAWTVDAGLPKRAEWSKSLRLFRDCLVEAIQGGRNHRPFGDSPEVRAVDVEQVRTIHKRRYVSGSGKDEKKRNAAERQAWSRALKDAREGSLIGGETLPSGIELLWFARAADEPL